MMEALRKGLDVIDHRVQHVEPRRRAMQAYLADEVEHAMQHRGK